MSTPITFYDLRVSAGVPASPNAWKTRYTLNYKGIPYKTTFVNFVDIKPTLQEAGIPPSEGEAYTVPAIIDHKTGQKLSESARIAGYLDAAYPETPAVFPASTREAQITFMKTIGAPLLYAAFPIILLDTFNGLDEKDKEYWRRTREARFGAPLEAIVPKGERLTAALAAVGATLDNAAKEIAKHAGEGALFFGGDAPSFADITLAAAFKAIITGTGREGDVSKVILGHEWASKFFEAFEKWASIEA
ncbi:hypothetical protein PENSPDRAFT_616282 [Peniophora sp. CONT]|nr:hypothetical protein PENSPDRAFT_616282 [Peniophora sp. CONT]